MGRGGVTQRRGLETTGPRLSSNRREFRTRRRDPNDHATRDRCRAGDDQGAEKVRATILYLPAEKYDAGKTPRPSRGARKHARTIRIRARIEGFDRERYRIGPKWTAGWLARVQQLAPVVSTEGTIDVNLFAMEPETP